jgi:hypothetical protein
VHLDFEGDGMTKLWIATAVIFLAWLHVHLADQEYQSGYQDAEMRLGTTAEQCFAWWFGENKKQHAHEIKQFCKKEQP